MLEELQPLDFPLCKGRALVAGPCSAESREQVMECARALKDAGMQCVLRAGVWKPRTSPSSFAGVGGRALRWLVDARRQTGLKVATEVATPSHVRQALRAGIDVLWIGARTSADPFAVQALAETIGREAPGVPVLVKNPVVPDLGLWIGALERLYKQGVQRLGAVHRGFGVYGSAPYRNAPLWHIPMELHRRFPRLPVLHDPSHTAGKSTLVPSLSQQAMDMGFNGLMIEMHPAPPTALSDAGQQLTPAELREMVSALVIREGKAPDARLQELRAQIDELDAELLSVLERRMGVCEQIGRYKRDAQMPVVQPDRFGRLLTSLMERGTEHGLEPAFLERVLTAIHAESVRRQLAIVDGKA